MTTHLTVTPTGEPDTASPPRALRRAGIWTLTAAAALALMPVTVFVIPWKTLAPDIPDGTSPMWRDPSVTSGFGWLGPVYAFQGLLFAVAIVTAALLLFRRGSRLALAQTGAAFTSAALFLTDAGITSMQYSVNPAGLGDITAVQADPAIREMIGITLTYVAQGLVGAAGIATLIWMLAVAADLRTTGTTGRTPLIVAAAFGLLIVVVFHLGIAAAGLLISVFPLAIIGFVLLAAGRRVSRQERVR